MLVADQAMARQLVPGQGMVSSLSLEVSGVRAWLMTQSREASAALRDKLGARHAAAARASSRGGSPKQSSSSSRGSEASVVK